MDSEEALYTGRTATKIRRDEGVACRSMTSWTHVINVLRPGSIAPGDRRKRDHPASMHLQEGSCGSSSPAAGLPVCAIPSTRKRAATAAVARLTWCSESTKEGV